MFNPGCVILADSVFSTRVGNTPIMRAKGLEKELGYVSLKELESVKGPMGLPIERDLCWKPRTLKEIAPRMFPDMVREEGQTP